MRILILSLIVAALAGLAACSTPDKRIAARQAEFDQYPAEAQQKIRAGQVAIGFTPAMVRLALGQPARIFNRRSDKGDSEVWSYDRSGPRFSVGLGVGSGGYSGVGGGVGVSSGGYDAEEKMRVEFREGKVVEIEEVKK